MLSRLGELAKSIKTGSFYARIDGIRKKSCQSTPKTSECMSVKGFEFTDKAVTNFFAHSWVKDSAAREKNGHDCLVLFVDEDNNNQIQTDVRSCITDSPLKAQVAFCSINSYQTFSDIREIKNS
ncbi:unnamed protein product [Caenorhabditis nigoni]